MPAILKAHLRRIQGHYPYSILIQVDCRLGLAFVNRHIAAFARYNPFHPLPTRLHC